MITLRGPSLKCLIRFHAPGVVCNRGEEGDGVGQFALPRYQMRHNQRNYRSRWGDQSCPRSVLTNDAKYSAPSLLGFPRNSRMTVIEVTISNPFYAAGVTGAEVDIYDFGLDHVPQQSSQAQAFHTMSDRARRLPRGTAPPAREGPHENPGLGRTLAHQSRPL